MSREKIRVISVRRDLIDPALAGAEELEGLCLAALTTPMKTFEKTSMKTSMKPHDNVFPNERYRGATSGVIDSILSLSAFLQSPYGDLISMTAPPMDEVALRMLLANWAVRPVVENPYSKTEAKMNSITIRAPSSIQAFTTAGMPMAFATGDQINVVGLAFDRAASGAPLIEALYALPRAEEANYSLSNLPTTSSMSNLPTIPTILSTGSYSASVLAVASSKKTGADRSAPFEEPQTKQSASVVKTALNHLGFDYLPFNNIHEELLESLAQTKNAANFYMSGAAAAIGESFVKAYMKQLAALSQEGVKSNILEGIIESPIGWQVAALERQKFLLDQLQKISIAPLTVSPDEFVYKLSPLNDLQRLGAFNTYMHVLINGRESEIVEEFLARAASAAAKYTAESARTLTTERAMSHARLLIQMVEEKLGSKRMQEIVAKLNAVARGAPGGRLAEFSASSTALRDPMAVLHLLTKNERTIVELAAKGRAAAADAAANNKCPHVRLLRKLRTAPDARSAALALADLRRVYLNEQSDKSRRSEQVSSVGCWLVCRSCGQNAICPHLIERIDLEGRGASYKEVRTRLEKYALQIGGDSGAYYCRCCAEQLALADPENDEAGRAAASLGRFGNLGAGLRTRVWAMTISAVRRVRFTVPTDERRFANAAADLLTPILEAEASMAAIAKRRRRETSALSSAEELREELDPRTELRASIFVYAYILDAIENEYAPAAFAGGKPGEKSSAVAARMLQLIMSEQGAQIAQIEDISAEYLRNQFTAAYKTIQSGAPILPPQTVTDHAMQLVNTLTTSDPIYRYAGTVAKVANALPVAPPVEPMAARREFEKIMGGTLPAILQSAQEAAKMPDLVALFARRPALEVPLGTTLEFWLKDPRVILYSPQGLYKWPKGMGESEIKAFYGNSSTGSLTPEDISNNIRYWLGGRVAPKSHSKVVTNTGNKTSVAVIRRRGRALEEGAFFEAWNLFHAYTTGVSNPEALAEYEKRKEAYRIAEDALRLEHAYKMVLPFDNKNNTTSQQFVPEKVPITEIYDENGEKHSWGKDATFYYQTAPKDAPKEIIINGAKETMTARNSGALPPDATLVDVGCAICAVRQSTVVNPTAEQIRNTTKALRAATELAAFFLFYETRCPAGGIHDWKTTSACSKCGLESSIGPIKNTSITATVKNYYEKFVATFRKERSENAIIAAATNLEQKDKEMMAKPKQTREMITFLPDYTKIVEAAAIAEVSPAVLEAIGAAAGREFADIKEGMNAPPPPTSSSDPRIFVADSAVRALLAEYNSIRKAFQDYIDLFNAAEIPPEERGAAAASLPDIGADYNERFVAISMKYDPADLLSYIIQQLCDYALDISSTMFGEQKLGLAIAKHLLTIVVRGVRRMSKPGTFDWALFSGRDDAEDEVPDEVGDVGEDVLNELVYTDKEEAPEDPFSGENMDYDTSEDNPNNQPE